MTRLIVFHIHIFPNDGKQESEASISELVFKTKSRMIRVSMPAQLLEVSPSLVLAP